MRAGDRRGLSLVTRGKEVRGGLPAKHRLPTVKEAAQCCSGYGLHSAIVQASCRWSSWMHVAGAAVCQDATSTGVCVGGACRCNMAGTLRTQAIQALKAYQVNNETSPEQKRKTAEMLADMKLFTEDDLEAAVIEDAENLLVYLDRVLQHKRGR